MRIKNIIISTNKAIIEIAFCGSGDNNPGAISAHVRIMNADRLMAGLIDTLFLLCWLLFVLGTVISCLL